MRLSDLRFSDIGLSEIGFSEFGVSGCGGGERLAARCDESGGGGAGDARCADARRAS